MLKKYLATRQVKKIISSDPPVVEYEDEPQWVAEAIKCLQATNQKEQHARLIRAR